MRQAMNSLRRMQPCTLIGQEVVRLLYVHTILQESGILEVGLTLCLDEAGGIPSIQEVCLPALAMRMAKSMGDRLYATWHSGVGPHRP